ncbi:MAG: DUF349 domain-containing protein [Arcanobacterium sp.]
MSESKSTPTPRSIPRPRPSAIARPALEDSAATAAAKWGRVDDEGNVWLRSSGAEAERIVGQYAAGGSEKDALGLYVRRFLDLQAQVSLLEARIDNISPEEAAQSLKALNEQLVEPAVVGDVQSLRARVSELDGRIAQRREQVASERAAAKKQALADRTLIVERAEEIAAQDPKKTHWKKSREELTALLDQWKHAQRHDARIDRPSEEALWKRFSSARTQFDRHRRQFFSERDAMHKRVIARKEEIIAIATELATSTDWGATAARYRDLMNDWKAAGRSTKREDDKLWERFRAAQQTFFDARTNFNAAVDEEFGANLEAKLELLAEAEKILPIDDVEKAKTQLRAIGDKWDAIGRVPRGDFARTEGRFREIERAVRDADAEQWRRSDPAKQERADGMAAQLEALIAELEVEIAEAEKAGDAKKLKELNSALEARKAWLATVLQD